MKTLNKITLAGLIFLGAGATNTKAQYSQKGWLPVTENEFNRLKIPEDSIQAVDLIKNKDSSRYTDNSKRGKKFTDTNGEKYFWVNPNPTGKIYSLNNNNHAHYTHRGENFNCRLQIERPYAYLGEDIIDKKGTLWKKGDKIQIPITNEPLEGIILRDKELNKEVLVSWFDYYIPNLEDFLGQIFYGGNIDEGIKNEIFFKEEYNRRNKLPPTTLEEKKNFIRHYFTDSIPNAIKNLPRYKAPIIYKEEFNKIKSGVIELAYTKPAKSIEMNEQKLDEILKEGEK